MEEIKNNIDLKVTIRRTLNGDIVSHQRQVSIKRGQFAFFKEGEIFTNVCEDYREVNPYPDDNTPGLHYLIGLLIDETARKIIEDRYSNGYCIEVKIKRIQEEHNIKL